MGGPNIDPNIFIADPHSFIDQAQAISRAGNPLLAMIPSVQGLQVGAEPTGLRTTGPATTLTQDNRARNTQAILGGLLAGLGQRIQNEENQKIVDVATGMRPPSDLSPSVFAPIGQGLQVFNTRARMMGPVRQAQVDLEEWQKERDLEREVKKAGLMIGPELEKAKAMLPLELEKTARSAIAGKVAEESTRDLKTEVEKRTKALKDEYNQEEVAKNWPQIEKSAMAFAKGVTDPGSMTDQALVRHMLFVLNPEKAKLGNFEEAIHSSESIPDALKGQFVKAATGLSELGPEGRTKAQEFVAREYDIARKQTMKVLKNYALRAEAAGVNPLFINPYGEPLETERLFTFNPADAFKTKAGTEGGPVLPGSPTPIPKADPLGGLSEAEWVARRKKEILDAKKK
jgi:hypothetical protein